MFPTNFALTDIPNKLEIEMLAAFNILHLLKYCSVKKTLFSLMFVLLRHLKQPLTQAVFHLLLHIGPASVHLFSADNLKILQDKK